MFHVRYCTAGIWHVVRFTRRAPALAFYTAARRCMPRHVSAVTYAGPGRGTGVNGGGQ
jgi:hypothetical protein